LQPTSLKYSDTPDAPPPQAKHLIPDNSRGSENERPSVTTTGDVPTRNHRPARQRGSGQIAPADRAHLRAWLARFAGRGDVAFALEGCTGWRYVAEELAGAGVAAHVAEPADTAFARGRKRHAKTGKTDSRHLRMLLAEGRLPECWIPPSHILECRALLETYHDLRAERTA
jgi:hypothetical protein